VFNVNAKSSFAQTEIKYLGYIMNKQGFRPDPKKVVAVQTWPVPRMCTMCVLSWVWSIISESYRALLGDSSASDEPDEEVLPLGLH
jgi:hypothetical protein